MPLKQAALTYNIRSASPLFFAISFFRAFAIDLEKSFKHHELNWAVGSSIESESRKRESGCLKFPDHQRLRSLRGVPVQVAGLIDFRTQNAADCARSRQRVAEVVPAIE